MVSLVVIVLAGCDRVSDPWSDTPRVEDSDYTWANPPNCAPDAPGVSLPAAQHDSLPPLSVPIHPNLGDLWALVAEHVPGGWAGLHYSPAADGTYLVLSFVDTTHLSESLDSLAVYYPMYVPGHSYAPGHDYSFQRQYVRIRMVRWGWEQLYDWYRYLQLAGLPGGIARTDMFENHLDYGVFSAADHTALLQRLSQLAVPCWLAAVYIGGWGVTKSAQPPPAAPGIAGP